MSPLEELRRALRKRTNHPLRNLSGGVWAVLLCLLLAMPFAQAQEPKQARDGEALRARYTTLHEQLIHNPFQRPLYVESSQTSDYLKGEVYALLEQPYVVVGPALQGSDNWCDILILHLNVKGCRAESTNTGDKLTLNIGRKFDQPLTDTYQFEFSYRVLVSAPDYQQMVLDAAQGPMGTSRYRIELEVVELDATHSFLHLSYAYAYDMRASLAMKGYLATIGRGKVGFSIADHKANAEPIYVDGMRGVVERNTMRYYIAVEAYLGALSAPAPQQVEQRLNDWHSGVERYPLQLHELERSEYLAMKHKEIQRQQHPQ